jgi:hypothetical protein
LQGVSGVIWFSLVLTHKGAYLTKGEKKPFRGGYKTNRYSNFAEIQNATSLHIVNQPS